MAHSTPLQINFFIFIRIIQILVSKLRAHQMRYTDYKFRWVVGADLAPHGHGTQAGARVRVCAPTLRPRH